MIAYLQTMDIKLLNNINKHLHNSFLDKAMPLFTTLGDYGLVWIIISLFLLINQNYRAEGEMIIVSLIAVTIIGEGLIKHLIKRSRPFTKLQYNTYFLSMPNTYSFPSGHSASSFSVAMIFIMMNNRYSLIVTLLALLIAFSRLYLNDHYPTDVFCGILVGSLTSIMVLNIF